MYRNKLNTTKVQELILKEIEKTTHHKDYDVERNLFDPSYTKSIDPIDLIYVFTKIFAQLPVSIEDVLTNYSFENFSIKGISELIIEKIN
ncbi:hypothetical protein [Enterococcus gallinarum]|uniref:hypothetical protein n=1 Tax=Enterococcus gallinarum TaxID=1353 RepID=UPI0018A9E1C4|nr:hypothetical protein [Enterococcus gallinarum]